MYRQPTHVPSATSECKGTTEVNQMVTKPIVLGETSDENESESAFTYYTAKYFAGRESVYIYVKDNKYMGQRYKKTVVKDEDNVQGMLQRYWHIIKKGKPTSGKLNGAMNGSVKVYLDKHGMHPKMAGQMFREQGLDMDVRCKEVEVLIEALRNTAEFKAVVKHMEETAIPIRVTGQALKKTKTAILKFDKHYFPKNTKA